MIRHLFVDDGFPVPREIKLRIIKVSIIYLLMTDKEIIIKIREGEINQFSHLVKAYSGRILGYIKSKLYDQHEAEDLVQNTFLSFYKAIGRFEIDKPVLPYLYAIAKNELKMYWRSHKIKIPLDENVFSQDDSSDQLQSTEILKLIKQLPKNQQHVLQLVSIGHSYQEIASQIKKPINTVRTLIRRGRINLKKLYEKNN